jgi:hypothetical protein
VDIIYREERDRWIKGDRHLRPLLRRLVRGESSQRSGMQMVVRNFLIGLRRRRIVHSYNRPFFTIGESKTVISFGLGINGVKGLRRATPLIAAIGFPYPSELPELTGEYNLQKFLQHSQWTLDLVRSADVYDTRVFDIWPAGIDTDDWVPIQKTGAKDIDVLIYDKIHWDRPATINALLNPIRSFLDSNRYSFCEVTYGNYTKVDFKRQLGRAKAMIFVSAHESQGLAYQECLSSGVPVMAWDPGYWLDPIRYKYQRPVVPATSVPYFDQRCGVTFVDINDFVAKFQSFFDDCSAGKFNPREFVLETLSIEKSTGRMLEIYNSIQSSACDLGRSQQR